MQTDYLLRKIPDEMLQAAHARAKGDQITLRHVLVELLRYFVDHGLPPYRRVRRAPRETPNPKE